MCVRVITLISFQSECETVTSTQKKKKRVKEMKRVMCVEGNVGWLEAFHNEVLMK